MRIESSRVQERCSSIVKNSREDFSTASSTAVAAVACRSINKRENQFDSATVAGPRCSTVTGITTDANLTHLIGSDRLTSSPKSPSLIKSRNNERIRRNRPGGKRERARSRPLLKGINLDDVDGLQTKPTGMVTQSCAVVAAHRKSLNFN